LTELAKREAEVYQVSFEIEKERGRKEVRVKGNNAFGLEMRRGNGPRLFERVFALELFEMYALFCFY
jgi:hypothetical protein